MKLRLMSLGACVFLLAGCVNLFHHIEMKNDGTMAVLFKAGMPKPLLTMMSESGGEAPEELGLDEIQSELESYVKVLSSRTIDNEFEYAAEVEFEVPQEGAGKADMVPFYDGKTLILPMAPSQGDADASSGEFDEMTAAFFSTAKHTVILEKANFPPIERVTLTAGGQESEVPFQEFPHNYLIEYPLSYVLFSEEGGVLQIDFGKGATW